MYGFEGEFRSRPEQNFAGASVHEHVNKLIERARREREERKEARRDQRPVVRVQSYVRSFLTRRKTKQYYRTLFDNDVNNLKDKQPSDEVLTNLVRQLVFFYNSEIDSQRLVWLSQHILRNSEKLLKSSLDKNALWYWHLKWILSFNIDLLNSSYLESFATPLQIIEEFTSVQSYRNIYGSDNAVLALRDLFQYLVKKCYFDSLRRILDTKIPTMFDVDTCVPHLAKSILEFVKRPFSVQSPTFLDEYTSTILDHFTQTFLKGPITDINHKFILPNLSMYQHNIDYIGPDFRQLVMSLTHSSVKFQPNINLFYSLLKLEPPFEDYSFVIKCHQTGREVNTINDYLDILSKLTNSLVEPSVVEYLDRMLIDAIQIKKDHNDSSLSDDDEEDDETFSENELEILELCSELLSESFRVNRIVKALEDSYSAVSTHFLLGPVCKLCQNMLMSRMFPIHKYKLLNTLAKKAEFLLHLWKTILKTEQQSLFGPSLVTTSLLTLISRATNLAPGDFDHVVPLLATFCPLFNYLLSTLHDSVFIKAVWNNSEQNTSNQSEFTAEHLASITSILKDVTLGLIELVYPNTRPSIMPYTQKKNQNAQAHLLNVIFALLRKLHSRDLLFRFCPEGLWVSNHLTVNSPAIDQPTNMCILQYIKRSRLYYRPFTGIPLTSMDNIDEVLTAHNVRVLMILKKIPFVLPFVERFIVFKGLLRNNEIEDQNIDDYFTEIHITVRRNYLYEDAFEKLSKYDSEIQQTLRVHIKSAFGLDEAGIDGGGLFREFLSELLKTAFDPNRGFFKTTNDNMLYPNPDVHLIQQNFDTHYFFIGRMLGKALCESVLVELPLAEFFLTKIIGIQPEIDFNYLVSLDPVMYNNLLLLKNYDGDVVDLGLDFTIVIDEFGQTRVEELKPNGSNITVTNENKIEYVNLMANYKLNVQIRRQCDFFRQGLENMVSVDWLRMFSNYEVQVLISGTIVSIDIEDLKNHVHYVGGYSPEDPTISLFWTVVNDFTDEQKIKLLKFVTSCSRPPLFGFKELHPPFCIQKVNSSDRLPTASTCLNILKMPVFKDYETLKEKLLYAIQSCAGFELS